MKRSLRVFALLAGSLIAAAHSPAHADTQASRFAIGFHSIDAPVGVRMWVTDRIGVDLGLGFVQQKNPGQVDPTLTLTSVTGEIGVPIALKTWERASLLLRPGFQYTHQNDYTVDFLTDAIVKFNDTVINATGELEAEIFLAPRVSVSASTGIQYHWIKTDVPDAVSESDLSLVGSDFSSLGFHVYLGGGGR